MIPGRKTVAMAVDGLAACRVCEGARVTAYRLEFSRATEANYAVLPLYSCTTQ